MTQSIEKAYEIARERYAALGVDTEEALKTLEKVAISMHCWQGDDVGGFESSGGLSGGGIMATGNYPGPARNIGELMQDLDTAYRLIPGQHRLNLHAIYLDNGGKQVDRNEIEPKHFEVWLDWAKKNGHGLDFNPTFFSHPKADDGFTLTHRDSEIRNFWIEHGKACRRIGESFGQELGTPCVTNVWIPDGYKDSPADRRSPRELLEKSLDTMFEEKIDTAHNLDAVESKLFGIGSESYVVGSHEFYLGYAVKNQIVLCLDAGHYHPTETIGEKFSAVMPFVPRLLLHVSRGVRWDSDHVVTLTDDLHLIANEIVRGEYLDRVHIGLDFFDASINRIAAWTIGTRNTLKALLFSLLQPGKTLKNLEKAGDYTRRLALMEESKGLPWQAVWDAWCERQNVPVGMAFMDEIEQYEREVLSKRD